MANQAPPKLFILIGISDVVIGLVLAGVGWSQGNTVLQIVGGLLALGGVAVATVFTLRKDRPTEI